MRQHKLISGVRFSFARFACVILVVFAAYGCASGGGTEGTWGRSISGILTSEQGQPQAGVQVELLETGSTATTDAAGLFTLERVELPETPINLRISDSDLDAVVTLEQQLPQQEVSVALSIKVQNQMAATIENVVVISATPTPRPTSVPTQAATPTSAPTATAIPGASTPTPTATPQATATTAPTATPVVCRGDLDGDKSVGLSDLALLLSLNGVHAGDPTYNPAADLNSDGVIDSADVTILQSIFGTVCP